MEILEVLDALEEKVEQAFNIPILNKSLIDKEVLLEEIEDIRLKLPEDLKQAKWVKEERKRIISEAQAEADGIIKAAEEKGKEMINEHEITKKAYDQANEIIASAQKNARDMRVSARQYADSLLEDVQGRMGQVTEILSKAREDIQK